MLLVVCTKDRARGKERLGWIRYPLVISMSGGIAGYRHQTNLSSGLASNFPFSDVT